MSEEHRVSSTLKCTPHQNNFLHKYTQTHLWTHTHAIYYAHAQNTATTYMHCSQSVTPLSLLCTVTYTYTVIPGLWLLTALMQPEAEATVLTQPLVFSLLASYRGSTKHNTFLSLHLLLPLLSSSFCFPRVKIQSAKFCKTCNNYQKTSAPVRAVSKTSLLAGQTVPCVTYCYIVQAGLSLIVDSAAARTVRLAVGSCDSSVSLFSLLISGPFHLLFLKNLQRK